MCEDVREFQGKLNLSQAYRAFCGDSKTPFCLLASIFNIFIAPRMKAEWSEHRSVEWVAVCLVCNNYHWLPAKARHWTGGTLYGWAWGTHRLASWLHGLHMFFNRKNDFIRPVKSAWSVRGTLNNLWSGKNNVDIKKISSNFISIYGMVHRTVH